MNVGTLIFWAIPIKRDQIDVGYNFEQFLKFS